MSSMREDLDFVISVLEAYDDALELEKDDRAYWRDVLKRRDKRLSAADETAWLIELAPGRGTPTWWGRVDDEDILGWTTDNQKAIRFAREQDAQAIIDDTGWNDVKATEHMWCD
jgi:hypothetical protein